MPPIYTLEQCTYLQYLSLSSLTRERRTYEPVFSIQKNVPRKVPRGKTKETSNDRVFPKRYVDKPVNPYMTTYMRDYTIDDFEPPNSFLYKKCSGKTQL